MKKVPSGKNHLNLGGVVFRNHNPKMEIINKIKKKVKNYQEKKEKKIIKMKDSNMIVIYNKRCFRIQR